VSIFFRAQMAKSSKVLCYGDSLTAGFFGSYKEYHPYAGKLSRKLGVPIDHVGMSGWRVDEMLTNAQNPSAHDIFGKSGAGLVAQLSRGQYDVCILMGGTNDLGANKNPDQILADLKALHGLCHARGIRTVAISIPESRFMKEQSRAANNARKKINKGLASWAKTLPSKVLFADMAPQVPYSAVSGDWLPDGLHMTRQGYHTFGDRLADLVHTFVLGAPGAPVQNVDATHNPFAPALHRWTGPMADITNRSHSQALNMNFGQPTDQFLKMIEVPQMGPMASRPMFW
jgi:lysophospholipase L1-like esterase